ncbi:MAG: periplasmic heavy metal sensor [Comamonadaceae bacterium]|nr:periplasmic heavy metal sensor [Comamonadaceae bacterium]
MRLLAASVLAGGVAFGAAAMPPGMAGGQGAMPMAGMPMLGGAKLDRMLDRVGASAEQRQQIRSITDSARSDLAGQRDARRDLALQMSQLFTQPTVDAAAAEALRQKMLAQHDQASQRMFTAMLDVSRVLTPGAAPAARRPRCRSVATAAGGRAEASPGYPFLLWL